MNTKQTLMAAALAVTCVTGAQAQCLTDAQAADMVANYLAKTPAANPENLSDADGACTRGKVNALLAQRRQLGAALGDQVVFVLRGLGHAASLRFAPASRPALRLASTNSSRSPSSTFCVSLRSMPVRRSLMRLWSST